MEEFEIQDSDDYTSSKDEQFSHQILVMKIMKKCIDAGSVEMRSGWVNRKVGQTGETTLTYIPDTRKVFIETVSTAENIMACDIDEDAEKAIKEIKEKLIETKKKLCESEKRRWDGMHPRLKQTLMADGIYHDEGRLNEELPFYQDFLEEKIVCYRNILTELTKLTQRLGFYEGEIFEA